MIVFACLIILLPGGSSYRDEKDHSPKYDKSHTAAAILTFLFLLGSMISYCVLAGVDGGNRAIGAIITLCICIAITLVSLLIHLGFGRISRRIHESQQAFFCLGYSEISDCKGDGTPKIIEDNRNTEALKINSEGEGTSGINEDNRCTEEIPWWKPECSRKSYYYRISYFFESIMFFLPFNVIIVVSMFRNTDLDCLNIF